MSVGNNIKAVRIERYIPQQDLARGVSCTQRSISRYETGESCPTLEMVLRIACYLNLGLDKLFYLKPDENAKINTLST